MSLPTFFDSTHNTFDNLLILSNAEAQKQVKMTRYVYFGRIVGEDRSIWLVALPVMLRWNYPEKSAECVSIAVFLE